MSGRKPLTASNIVENPEYWAYSLDTNTTSPSDKSSFNMGLVFSISTDILTEDDFFFAEFTILFMFSMLLLLPCKKCCN